MLNWPPELQALAAWLPGWPDPPWRMRGTTVTAWFVPPRPLLESVLGLLRDDEAQDRPARVRFYDIEFAGQSRSPNVAAQGRFREAVVALPARVTDRIGEVSAFMWTDSDTYLTWGREAFGWPLRRAVFDLAGGVWDGSTDGGTARAAFDGGAITIEVAGEAPAISLPPVPGSGTWITPRMIVPSDPSVPGQIEINGVTPRIVTAGVQRSVRVHAQLSLPAGHPLHGLDPAVTRAELRTGCELVVGETVEILGAY
jgi:Acetoacetate decarboxylase (ADC)